MALPKKAPSVGSMITLRSTALCLFTLLTVTLAAKEYTIPTNSKAITAILTPVSQGNLINILKDIANDRNYEKFTKSYMLVDVVIKNNSPNAILLARDAYLENGELFIVPKDYIVSLYNQKIMDSWGILFGFYCWTGICGVCSLVMMRKNELFNADAYGSLTALGLVGSYFTTKWLTILRRKTSAILQTAQLSKGVKKRRYRAKTTRYKVPAGSTFRDKLLIDLNEVSITFPENYPTSLLYKEVTK